MSSSPPKRQKTVHPTPQKDDAPVSEETTQYSDNVSAAIAYMNEHKFYKKFYMRGGSVDLPPEYNIRDLNFSTLCDGDKYISIACLLAHLPEIITGLSEEVDRAGATAEYLKKEVTADLEDVPRYEEEVAHARKKVEDAQRELHAAEIRLRRAKTGGDLYLVQLRSDRIASNLRYRLQDLVNLRRRLKDADIEL